MPKNIVIFSDGTGQEGGKGNNTNVYRLFNMIRDRSQEQIGFYDRGLGTGWRKVLGNVSGAGISKNILECYRFIFNHFQTGDRIFLFGFSRGATTVRSLSSFIHLFGILPQSRPELIKKAWRIYRIGREKRRDIEAKRFLDKHTTMWARIRFLGAWDTVAALGVPFDTLDVLIDKVPFFRHRFQDLTLSPSVENAYHAIAIDDEREMFHPVLWDAECEAYQRIRQVWFCGMHTDVGGGYPKSELSDITLQWLTQRAMNHGLLLYPKSTGGLAANANGHMHDSRGTLLTRLYRRRARAWDASRPDRPIIHASVLERTRNTRNMDAPPYRSWISAVPHDVEPWDRRWPPRVGE